MKKIRIGRFMLDVGSALVGALGMAVLSALPVIGGYITKLFTMIRGMVSNVFNKQ